MNNFLRITLIFIAVVTEDVESPSIFYCLLFVTFLMTLFIRLVLSHVLLFELSCVV